VRKTLIAIALGASALVAAACGPGASSPSTGAGGATTAPLESASPMVSATPLASPSESPASS
jgi:ABC-type glycerol-3-phosphate transport system substrate-binding protein